MLLFDYFIHRYLFEIKCDKNFRVSGFRLFKFNSNDGTLKTKLFIFWSLGCRALCQ